MLGGIISFAFQHVGPHAPLSGWKIMFIVLGLVTSIIGCFTFYFIPDTPMTARFLNETEKVALLKHISSNKTGIRNSKFQPKQIIEAVLDPQLWLLTLIVILVCPTLTNSRR